MRISGYLSIYNDWDLLTPALRSVAPYLDELVVVDGAYSWMAPLIRQLGRQPERSQQPVRDALAACGMPVRIIEGVWANEVEKRRAGYAACQGRYVLRLDADEVLFFDAVQLERFLASSSAVAEMEMPNYLAPGFIQGKPDGTPLPRQAFLFDRQLVSPEQHLHHLWLVLTVDALPPAEVLPVFPEVVAFNAHLTTWRTPQTAVQRALFYSLNWSRRHGISWIETLKGRPLDDVAALLRYVPANAFLETMLSHRLVSGLFDTAGEPMRPTPLSPEQERSLKPLHANFVDAQIALNRELTEQSRHIIQGEPICLDLSSSAGLDVLARHNCITLELFKEPRRAEAVMHYTLPRPPWEVRVQLAAAVLDTTLQITLPGAAPETDGFLRRILVLKVWIPGGQQLQAMLCLAR